MKRSRREVDTGEGHTREQDKKKRARAFLGNTGEKKILGDTGEGNESKKERQKRICPCPLEFFSSGIKSFSLSSPVFPRIFN